MQTLSSAHFQNIEYTIKGGDYNYISAHFAVDIPGDDILFAKIQINGNSAQWYVDSNEKYIPITVASEEDRIAALQDLRIRKERILKSLSGKVPYATDLFTIPSEDQIFCCKRGDKVYALLAQWGFKKRHDTKREDIIKFLLSSVPEPPEPVDVIFFAKGSDGIPVGEAPFVFNWIAGGSREFKTDANGESRMGSMMPGVTFSIADKTGNTFPFTVSSGVNIYEATIQLSTDYSVRVENQDGTHKPQFPLSISGESFITDNEGYVRVTGVPLAEETIIEVSDRDGHAERFKLERKGNDFIFNVTDIFYSSLCIQVQWDDNEIIPETKVKVNGETHITDESGKIVLEKLTPGDRYTVYPEDNLAQSQNITLQRGKNELTIVKEKIPPKKVRIRLFDRKKRPIKNTLVKLKLAAGPYEATTDEEGCIYIPETMFNNREIVEFSFEYNEQKTK